MPISRRELLQAAGMGAAALAAGATGVRLRAGGPSRAAPDWTKLRSRLAGRLILPGEPGYETARLSFNPLFDARRPAAMARCARPEDVQHCVAAAAAAGMPIAARGGGHSYAGYSTPEAGLVVDLSAMAGVEVRLDGTAAVGAGARLIDVYAALARAGRCLPAGSCPTVGIAGLTLGGGVGVLARKLGLTCDRLTAAQVVTADAMFRTASAASEPDLFWALRGGGGGNLGIVTTFIFATAPAPPELTVFSLRFPAGAVAGVLGAWQAWAPSAPDELWSNCIVSAGEPPACRVGGCFVGGVAALAPLLDGLVRRAGATPLHPSVRSLGYLDAMRYFGGCSRRTVGQCRLQGDGSGQLAREAFVASSRIMARPVADPGRVASLLHRPPGVDALFDALGGAVGRVAAGATAFPHRAALATAQVYASAAGRRRWQAAHAVAEVGSGLGALLGTGAYVNYIDPALPDWAGAYYASNLGRLREVAHRYDPGGILAFPQGLTRA
ncbi:MAG TPA: FAD-binding oxidoreductase [Thermoanaerobaculia bacterium]|nr:FAD-binding oxidoreductase [Thermoanaerobaculia bacterium]